MSVEGGRGRTALEHRPPSNLTAGDPRGSPAREVAMVSERQLQETIARCVSCMVFYVNSGKTRQAKREMIAEAQAAASLLAKWGLSGRAAEDSFLKPFEAEMVARYGPADSRKLSKDFVEAFNGLTGSGPVLTPSRA